MKVKKVLLVLPAIAVLAACGGTNTQSSGTSSNAPASSNVETSSIQGPSNSNVESKPSSSVSAGGNTSQGIPSSSDKPSSTPISVDPSSSTTSISNPTNANEITDLSLDGISYDATNKVFEITKAGEYAFSGQFEGNIVVNAGDEDDVKVTLNEFTIISSKDAPIKCNTANELQVSLKKSTHNYIYDNRAHRVEADETQGNGAITSSSDLKISGKGSLNIVANYFNGIHSKDDLKVKPDTSENGGKIQINSYNNCLKGNDSVTIESGNLVLISTDGNGVMTESTDISSKGNQRGDITISGGQVDIYCSRDGLDAAHDVNIYKGETATSDPIVNIYTHKYSQYSNIGTKDDDNDSTDLYLKVSSYNNQYYFGVEFKNANGDITWVKANTTTTPSGSRSSYFKLSKPKDAVSLRVCNFQNSVSTMSEDNAYAKMKDFSNINTNFNMATLSVSGTTISISSWSNYSTQSQGGGGWGGGPGGMQEGNNDKSEYSAKGIKAHNNITISAGTFYIKAYDDTLHASYGDTFENGLTGEGKLNISGGYFTLYAADDAVHADNEVNISGGTIDILTSYEGVEGNTINISGGYTKVYALDDGLNSANKAGKTPNINISGGITDVTVYGNDIDGIDSNGNFTMTGGIVVTKGGTGGMSTGFDIDGTAKVNGGTFIGMGPMEKTPTAGSGITNYSLSGSWSAGTHVITFPDSSELTVTTKYSYSQVRVWSDNANKISVK